MNISGLQKLSLVDYPGKTAVVVFTRGCPLRCPYCHNPGLVDPARYHPLMRQEEMMAFLKSRRGLVDAVVISGGEPLLQPDVVDFCRAVKAMGFWVKCDTCGLFPDKLKRLLQAECLDMVALDIKVPFERYERFCRAPQDTPQRLKRTLDLLKHSGTPFYLRTTISPAWLSPEDFKQMVAEVGADLPWRLQPFRPAPEMVDESFRRLPRSSSEALQPYHDILTAHRSAATAVS